MRERMVEQVRSGGETKGPPGETTEPEAKEPHDEGKKSIRKGGKE